MCIQNIPTATLPQRVREQMILYKDYLESNCSKMKDIENSEVSSLALQFFFEDKFDQIISSAINEKPYEDYFISVLKDEHDCLEDVAGSADKTISWRVSIVQKSENQFVLQIFLTKKNQYVVNRLGNVELLFQSN